MQATTTEPRSKRPPIRDLDQLRCLRLGRFTVRTFDLGEVGYGRTAIGYRVTESGRIVAECYARDGAMITPSGTVIDSDATVRGLIALVTDAATIGDDGARRACAWGADDLADESAMRWCRS